MCFENIGKFLLFEENGNDDLFEVKYGKKGCFNGICLKIYSIDCEYCIKYLLRMFIVLG